MDIVTYALLKGEVDKTNQDVEQLNERVDNVTLAYSYKGSVSSVSDLPDDADAGDLYTIDGIQYVWDGEDWIVVQSSVAITNSQIDSLFDGGE